MTSEADNPTLKALQDQFASRVFDGYIIVGVLAGLCC